MEIFLMASAITVSFLIAFVASALHSLTQERIQSELDSQTDKANELQEIKLHFEEIVDSLLILEVLIYLPTVYLLNTILNNYLLEWYFQILILSGTILFVLTLRSVIQGLGNRFADSIIISLLPLIRFLRKLSKPFYTISSNIVKSISKQTQEEASREELSAMFETAHEEGTIETDEYRILKNIIHFNDVLVTDVMTPRTVVFTCEADLTVSKVVDLPELQMYSRFPIFDGESLDEGVVGYVMSKDILHAALVGNGNKKLRDFSREIFIIPESADLDKALEHFLQSRQHIAIVVDEYGGVEGLVTMEDVLETILGVEIVDEADKVVDLREMAKLRRDKRIASITK